MLSGSRINEVWQLELGQNALDSLWHIIENFKTQEGRFDWKFDYNATDLYCSEFLQKSLELLDSNRFGFPLVKKPLNFLMGRMLKRDTLVYSPVDFFVGNASFSRVFPE